MNERPVDVQSRDVTEPQRDAGAQATEGVEFHQTSMLLSFISLPLKGKPDEFLLTLKFFLHYTYIIYEKA